MSSVEEGWSIEYGDFVDPETAYELFWNDVIRDKQGFICPFCNAKMTCINIDVEEQNWGLNPHFRGFPRHEDGCKENRIKSSSSEPRPRCHDVGKTDVLCFDRPKGFFSPRISSRQPQSLSHRPQKRKHSTNRNRYSIRPLVSKFIAYRMQGTLADNFISIENETWSYESLFTGVFNQSKLITERPVIYWGTGRVLWVEKTQSYLLKFCKPFVHQEQKIHPSLFISQSLLDDYPVKRLLEKRLKKAVENKTDHRAFVFVYGAPSEKIDAKTGRVFLNFEPSSLDFIEIRSLSLFDRL
ncbi:TPA: hypothetical protein ACGZ84_004378 [Vibrio parahaemolyticus]